MSCDDGTCLDCGRELTGPDGTDCAHCDAKQAASDKRRAEHGNELAVLRDEVKRLREENDRLRRRSVAACLDGVKALYDKAHAVWQANPGPSDWISEFEEAFESTCAALAAARDEARGCMPTGAGLATELAEARARCVELEGRVAAAERLAEEERGRSDRWKEAAELAARIAAPDAARKDLETAVAAMWFAWPLVAGPGVDPGKLLNVIGTGDSPIRRYATFLAAHPLKPSGP